MLGGRILNSSNHPENRFLKPAYRHRSANNPTMPPPQQAIAKVTYPNSKSTPIQRLLQVKSYPKPNSFLLSPQSPTNPRCLHHVSPQVARSKQVVKRQKDSLFRAVKRTAKMHRPGIEPGAGRIQGSSRCSVKRMRGASHGNGQFYH